MVFSNIVVQALSVHDVG